MSGAPSRKKGLGERALQAVALAFVFGVMILKTRHFGADGPLVEIMAIGFLLLSGVLMSELFEIIGLPHLTGYLAAGVIAGPNVLHLLSHDTVTTLSPVNKLALALIALAGGAELELSHLKSAIKSLAIATLLQSTLVLAACALVFFGLVRFIPFLQGSSAHVAWGAALLWGALSITRSPAALLAILAQTRASGPVARFGLNFVMSSDVVVVIVLALTFMVSRPLLVPGAGLALRDLEVVGHEILGSISIGTTFGLLFSAYLRLIGKALIVVLIGVGFVLSDILKYLHFDPLLVFIIAGFIVQNFSKQGPKLLHAVSDTGSVVYVVFFATAGAHLDLPLLRTLWPIALALAGARAAVTVVAHSIGSRLAGDEPVVRRWGWTPLVSQAGLALGLAVVVSEQFPEIGAGFLSLAIAMVAINEVVGPILFKFALDRAGETKPAEALEPSETVAH